MTSYFVCVCRHKYRYEQGGFPSSTALEQQSHKQTAVLSGESAISLSRAASVLQQAINTESIIAPEGAAGQGGQKRHHLKGQCLQKKQEGQGIMGTQGCTRVRQRRRMWAASDQMECKAAAICHPQAILWGEAAVFSTGQEYVPATRGIN